eukprot:Awhi_evm1s379
MGFFVGFAVKLPLFGLHLWLPRAHVEANLAGSIVLAGVLLKLGSFGLFRYSLFLMPASTYYNKPLIYTLCILGIIYCSFTTIRQFDLKRIIAYSSVSHMGAATLGLVGSNSIGLHGSVFLMLAHGLTAPGLFIAVSFLYFKLSTKNLKYYSGLTSLLPLLMTNFLILNLANLGLPLTANFIVGFGPIPLTYNLSTISNNLAVRSTTNLIDCTRLEFFGLTPIVILVLALGLIPQSIILILTNVIDLTSARMI